MNNKYYRSSKILEAKFRHLIKCFTLDLTATKTAELTGISLRSVTVILDKLRTTITGWCDHGTPMEGSIEVDESYFGPRRIPGKHGHGRSKTIVFGIFKRQGQVYTEFLLLFEGNIISF